MKAVHLTHRRRFAAALAVVMLFCGRAPAVETQPASYDSDIQPATTAPAATHPADTQAAEPESLNFVFIVANGLMPGMTGFEGHETVRTPNLDRLARDSARFTRFYTPTPLSGPSLASMLTGLHPQVHGMVSDDMPLPADNDSFANHLKSAGYATGLVGHWPLGLDEDHRPGFGFDHAVVDDSEAKWIDSGVWVNGRKQTADGYLTDWHGRQAGRFINRHRNQPFLLWLSFRAPGDPLEYPPDMKDAYPPGEIELPRSTFTAHAGLPPKLTASPPAKRFSRQKVDTLKEARSKYYAMITRLDDNVGRVLNAIEEADLAGRTVIIFVSSHGRLLGDHRLYGPGPVFYEAAVRVPMLVRVPGVTDGGRQVDQVCGVTHLGATLLELARIRTRGIFRGGSLVRLIQGERDRRFGDEYFLQFSHSEDFFSGPRPPTAPTTAQPPNAAAPRPAPRSFTRDDNSPGGSSGELQRTAPRGFSRTDRTSTRPSFGRPDRTVPRAGEAVPSTPRPPRSNTPSEAQRRARGRRDQSPPPPVVPTPEPAEPLNGPQPDPSAVGSTQAGGPSPTTAPTAVPSTRPTATTADDLFATDVPTTGPAAAVATTTQPTTAAAATDPATSVATTQPATAPTAGVPTTQPALAHASGGSDAAPATSSAPAFPPAPAPLPPPPPYRAPARAIVTQNYKLIDYLEVPDLQDVLYDLQNDPEERYNLISDPHYVQVIRVLRERLSRWRDQIGDDAK